MQISEYKIITLLFMSLIHFIPFAGKKDYFIFFLIKYACILFRAHAYVRSLMWKTAHKQQVFVLAKLLQSYLTLCDPMDCSPPGYSVHEILQARILE